MTNPNTFITHLDDFGDIEVHLLSDPNSPCPGCGTSAEADGWNYLTRHQAIEVFRCPTCSLPSGINFD